MKNKFIELLKLLYLYSVAKTVKRLINSLINRYRNIYHHKEALHFYSQFIKKKDLCFDVGTNIGSRTELFLELGAKIICIEPQKACL